MSLQTTARLSEAPQYEILSQYIRNGNNDHDHASAGDAFCKLTEDKFLQTSISADAEDLSW